LCLGVSIILLTLKAQAQASHATFDGHIISLPAVIIDGVSYKVELQRRVDAFINIVRDHQSAFS
jgi:hypothetical protein